ncbi:hypothetical protein GX48_03120 [Paracoccidioides brasiliensis]|nr:hypothetical protein GX48_03120 [Paracoccidioides brasiliensis]
MADFYQSPYALTTGPIFAIMEHIIQPDMTLSMAIHELFSFDSFAQRTNHLGVPAATLDGIVAGQVANGGTNHLRNHDSAFVGRIPVLDFELQFRDRDALLERHWRALPTLFVGRDLVWNRNPGVPRDSGHPISAGICPPFGCPWRTFRALLDVTSPSKQAGHTVFSRCPLTIHISLSKIQLLIPMVLLSKV